MRSRLSIRSWIALAAVALAGCGGPAPAPSASPADLEALRGALSAALDQPDPYQRVHQLATLLAAARPGSAPELKRALEEASNRGLGVAEYDLLMRAWAEEQPEEATHWILALAPVRVRPSAIQIAVEAWARKDPKAAVADVTWAAQSGIRDVAQSVQHGIVRGWFQADRPGVEKYIQSLTGIEQQRSMLAYALSLQAAEGSDALMRWAEAIPDDDEDRYKTAMFRQVAIALAWADRPAAERWCERQCDGPHGKGLRTTITRIRLQNGEEGSAVLKWVGDTPESESQVHALRVGFQLWGLKDDDAARAWMRERLADGTPWVDKLYGAYARQLAVHTPAEAIPWAEKIPGERTRREMMVRIARRWMRLDPAAASAWLDQSPLSEEERASARDLTKRDYLPGERELHANLMADESEN